MSCIKNNYKGVELNFVQDNEIVVGLLEGARHPSHQDRVPYGSTVSSSTLTKVSWILLGVTSSMGAFMSRNRQQMTF